MKRTELKLVTTQHNRNDREIGKKLNPIVAQAVELIKAALKKEGFDPNGYAFGKNQFIFDEFGTVSSFIKNNSIFVSYDLDVNENLKAIVAIALQDLQRVSYSTNARYKDCFGRCFVDEEAYIFFAYDLIGQNTEFEHQKELAQLLQMNAKNEMK